MRPNWSLTGALRHIHHIPDGLCAQGLALLDSFVHASLFDVADDDGGAFLGKFEGCGQANALGCAGDDADLVFESWHEVDKAVK
jgi:hypothetical protein